MSKEIWKPIDGYEGMYEVSNLGRVRSWHESSKVPEVPRILSQGNTRGYRVVNLPRLDRKGRYTPLVHRIVAETFIGPPPDCVRPTVNHKNLDKADNRVQNLEWMAHAENNRHAAPLIPRLRGEQIRGARKLTEAKVKEMRALRAVGWTCLELGKKYGVSDVTVWNICKRRKWAHVE